MQRKKLLLGLGAAAIALLALFGWRHEVAQFLLSRVVGISTGYRVQFGEMRLGTHHGAFIGVHVSRRGEPILDAARVDVYYDPRDLLPGGSRRFGFAGISINHPQLTIIHHRDGSYNLAQGRGGGIGAPGQSGAGGAPLHYYARIRNGEMRLIDEYQYYKEARLQVVHKINADLSVKSDERTHYAVSGAFVDVKDQPLHAAGTIDYQRGYAMHRLVAQAIPLTAVGNYIINSPAAHILAGTAKGLDAKIYALGFENGAPLEYHVGATAQLSDGQLYVRGLAKPLSNLRGPLQIFDGGLAAPSLQATLGNVPVRIAGTIFDFRDPQFRLGVHGAGDLRDLRTIVAGGHRPLSGGMRVATLIEGSIAKPLIVIGFNAPNIRYGAIPLTAVSGLAALYENRLALAPVFARYGAIGAFVRGELELGRHVGSQIAVHFEGAGNELPYLAAVLPGRRFGGDAVMTGTDADLASSGYVADLTDPSRLGGMFALRGNGVGTIGPVAMQGPGGGSLVGAYTREGPGQVSALWVSARGFHLEGGGGALPGLQLPALPAMRGTLDGDFAGGALAGRPLALAGRAVAGDAVVSGVKIDRLAIAFSGTPSNLGVGELHASGPWGSLDGGAGYSGGALVVGGDYRGSLEGLTGFTGDIGARGRIDAPIAVVARGANYLVQTRGAALSGASVRGVPVQSLSGTVGYGGGALRVYALEGKVGGASAAAAGRLDLHSANSGALSVATGPIEATALRNLGLPAQSGTLRAVGDLGLGAGAPTFSGQVALDRGRVAGYQASGNSQVDFRAHTIALTNASLALGGTYGFVNGTISGVGAGAPQYDLLASVRAGDIAKTAAAFAVPTHNTIGSYDADLRVRGAGAAPVVSGPVAIPEGSTNGLNFDAGSGLLNLRPGALEFSHGGVTVGSTRARFSALLTRSTRSLALHAPRADLADFNDYFDEAETFAGHGSLDATFTASGSAVQTAGVTAMNDFRYRRFALGAVNAAWSSSGSRVTGSLQASGKAGRLGVQGSVAVANPTSFLRAFRSSRYSLRASMQGLDLNTWLPALGYSYPITGHINAVGDMRGRYPALAITSRVSLVGGTIGRVPIDSLELVSRSNVDRTTVSSLVLNLPAVSITGSGSFGLARTAPLAFAAHARGRDLGAVVAQFTGRPLDAGGSIEADMHVAGTRAVPLVTGGFDIEQARYHGMIVPRAYGVLALHGKELIARDVAIALPKGTVSVAGALPLQLEPFGIGPGSAPIGLDLSAKGVDLGPFTPLFPAGTKLGGIVDGRVGVAGSVDRPRLVGQLALLAGSYSGPWETVPINDTVGIIAFAGQTATLTQFHSRVGFGTLDGSGTAQLPIQRGQSLSYALSGTAHDAALNFPAYGHGVVNGKIALARASSATKASADITISDAVVPFSALYRPAAGGGGGGTGASGGLAALPNLGLDLKVRAAKNVRVRGSGLDIGAQGNIAVGGTLASPQVSGRFDSTGGTLTYFDRSFRVSEGYVAFSPEEGIVPVIHAVGKTHVSAAAASPTGSVDITIAVDGPVTSPQISFTTDPPGYSREQVLALLTPVGLLGNVAIGNTPGTQPGTLRGAPGESNPAIPPGVLVRQNGTVTIGEEAFNILNAQFARGLLSPLETAFGGALGLTDLSFDFNYSGGFGFRFRRLLSHNFYAVYSTSLGYPTRQSYGFTYQPNDATAAQMTFFSQQGNPPLFGNPNAQISTNPRITTGEPLGGNNGFSFTLQRLFP